MKRAPKEFADLLSRRGRALLRRGPQKRLTRTHPFRADDGLLEPRLTTGLLGLLERELFATLKPMVDPIPGWTIAGMRDNYSELLPKTVRVLTATFESPRSRSWRVAQSIGLVEMLQSPSMHEFAEKFSGHRLARGHGIQALCYRPGDYAGPHNDHHPEEPEARHGYVDLHLTLCTPGVGQQLLVYEDRGHLSQVRAIDTLGGVTCYRLPFWHYTTPLVARPGRAPAHRWVLLSTFIDAAAAAERR